VRKFRIQTDGFRAWTESDVAQFVAHHPVGKRWLCCLPDSVAATSCAWAGNTSAMAPLRSNKSKPECRC
jgi:hypothetical protein